MKVDETKLREKGWSEEEIEHAKGILLQAEQTKHPHMKALEKATYWILFIILVAGAIAITWLMEPLLIVMNTTQAILTFAVAGGLFGTLASILIQDIDHTQQHHHAIIAISIPAVALVTSVTIVTRINKITEVFTDIANHNPYILAGIFAVSALIPYGIILFIRSKRDKHNGTRRVDDTPYQVQGLYEKKDSGNTNDRSPYKSSGKA